MATKLDVGHECGLFFLWNESFSQFNFLGILGKENPLEFWQKEFLGILGKKNSLEFWEKEFLGILGKKNSLEFWEKATFLEESCDIIGLLQVNGSRDLPTL